MTIKDIAKESGYSVGTVSRVLNHSAGVSDKAKKSIMEVVDKYHFCLNSNAKHLKKQSSEGIAIIIKDTQNMLFSAIVDQMQSLLRRKEYNSVVYYLNKDDNELEEAIKICAERRPIGILFLGVNTENLHERFSEIKIPCVLVTNSASNLGFENLSSVSTDDEAAGRFAVEHLLSLGHTHIGIMGGEISTSQIVSSRYQGCQEAFRAYHIPFDPNTQYEATNFGIAEGYHAMEHLLDHVAGLSAVFAMSDVLAIGAIRAVKDRGLRVPEDVSVIGFDGIDMGNYISPRLTTIRQHREGIACRSVEILLKCIDEDCSAVHEIEPFHLVPGESVYKH
ncbi:MAG: LacI family DNA-binding transcriptional regulator [Frisingicoccus sp.]|nr:LacI family DNA-binding transcriptional regulator [Frisingicoccus sp.]